MFRRGVKRDSLTYASLFEGFRKADQDLDFGEIYEMMKEDDEKPSLEVLNTILNAYGERGMYY